MSINLLQSMQNTIAQLNRGDNPTAAAGAAGNAAEAAARLQAAMKSELMNLLPGSTLQGQLVNQDGKNIQLLLNNSLLLNTKIESEGALPAGNQMTFEVKSNQQGQLTLRPLFANMANSETATAALKAAGIGVSDETMRMVSGLMEKGMPVNKDMLNLVNKEMSMYPKAPVEDIIMLHKMDLPVNENNLNQIHLYMNNNQYMLESVEGSADMLTDLLLQSLSEGDGRELLEGLKNLLNGEQQTVEEATVTRTEDGKIVISDRPELPAEVENPPEAVETKAEEVILKPQNEAGTETNRNTAAGLQTNTDIVQEESGRGQNTVKAAGRPVINKDNVLELMDKLPSNALKNPRVRIAIRNSLAELLKDNMLMKPEEFGKEGYVKKYYNNISNLTEGIDRLLEQQGKLDTPFARSNGEMRSNISFMNQVNELYNYVQLPMKMNASQANGDLYVYTRKRGKRQEGDESLTALLHLSMEALGNMDIFLSLKSDKLSTNFCLEKEENIDFIESHIEELNARLAKKGYNVATTVGKLDSSKQETTIEKIINEDKVLLLNTQSFDARA